MKNKTLIILFIVSSVFVLIAAYMKIMHHEYNQAAMAIALLFQIGVIAAFIIKALRTKPDDFWNN